jgi:hypothetical protein
MRDVSTKYGKHNHVASTLTLNINTSQKSPEGMSDGLVVENIPLEGYQLLRISTNWTQTDDCEGMMIVANYESIPLLRRPMNSEKGEI